MIVRAAEKMARHYSSLSSSPEKLYYEYAYGFQLLLSTAINTLLIVLLSLVFGAILETLFFMVSFISLRITAGGYHAKSHISCIFLICATYTALALLITLLPQSAMTMFSLLCIVASALIVWAYSPVAAVNKPIGSKQKLRLQSQSFVVVSVLMLIALASHLITAIPTKLVAFGMSGALAATASAYIARKIITKGETQFENAYEDRKYD